MASALSSFGSMMYKSLHKEKVYVFLSSAQCEEMTNWDKQMAVGGWFDNSSVIQIHFVNNSSKTQR